MSGLCSRKVYCYTLQKRVYTESTIDIVQNNFALPVLYDICYINGNVRSGTILSDKLSVSNERLQIVEQFPETFYLKRIFLLVTKIT